jgi:TfoX/Sxy family transcriptional regulator of competence genes
MRIVSIEEFLPSTFVTKAGDIQVLSHKINRDNSTIYRGNVKPDRRKIMAYNEALAVRLRQLLDGQPELVEKKMFGGIGFMLRGNMACGLNKDDLIVRVGPENYETAVIRPYARPFDITGRPMKGWVMVAPDGYAADDDLKSWVEEGVDLALSLPPK